MRNIFPIMQLTKEKTLVERRNENGEVIEYIICHNLIPIPEKENEYEWDNGMYSFTLEGILKTAALNGFSPVYKYIFIESNGGDIEENVFDSYEEARAFYEEKKNFYRERENYLYTELCSDNSDKNVETKIFYKSSMTDLEVVILKIVEIAVS